MRLLLLCTMLFAFTFGQTQSFMTKDGLKSRYEEKNGDDKVRVYRVPKTNNDFTNSHPIIPNDSPTYKGRTDQEMFDMGVTSMKQLYLTGWRLAASYTSGYGSTPLLIFERK